MTSKVTKKTIAGTKSYQQSFVDNLPCYSNFVSLCGFQNERLFREAMICFPTAKINLGLRITEKRPDGYHNLETIFYPIGLRDALELVPTAGTDYQLTVSGIMTESDQENNLVTKAFRLVQQTYSLFPVSAYLHKAIPSGAGLGGGSSDAAFMLNLLNDIQRLALPANLLEELAGRLGSDCPFFIKNEPMYATGTGNVFEPTSVSLKNLFLILVKPDISVSTAEAYAHIKPKKPERLLNELIKEPVESWKDLIINDFEAYVFSKHPSVGQIKHHLYDQGAIFASMTGSGSAIYGLFDHPVDLRPLFKGCFYWSEKFK